MKKLFPFFVFNLLFFSLFAENEYRVLPYKGDTVLNSYLISSMHQQYAGRRLRFNEALKSVSNLKAYQQEIKKRYRGLFLNFPNNMEDAMPMVDSVGSIACDGYRIDKLILSNRITTNLYIPNGDGRKPAVLFFCGHEMTSKTTESYQKTAILFAKHGFVVLVIDPTGQGERVQLTDSTGRSLTRGSTTEHTLLNEGASLIGWSVANEELIDNYMCMNFLCSRAEVDKQRIGCIGNSGGGTQTTFYSAMDARIKVAACCSWFTKRERMLTNNGPDDGCQHLWDEGQKELEIADYYIMQAPRPTLILAGTKDFIDYRGTLEAFDELSAVFKLLKRPKDVKLFSVEDGHGISQTKREAAVSFFMKYLLDKDEKVEEGALTTLPDSVLRCTPNGQISLAFPQNPSLQERCLSMADHYAGRRAAFRVKGVEASRAEMRNLLAIPQNLGAVNEQYLGQITTDKALVGRYIINRIGELPLPAVLFLPKKGVSADATFYLLLNDSCIGSGLQKNLLDSLIRTGNPVLMADLRGMGETADLPERNNKKFYSSDYRNAVNSLLIGRSLLGQRVIDIFSLLDFINLHSEFKGLRIECCTVGNVGVVAMHAAYLDKRIDVVRYSDCIQSWTDIIRYPLIKNRMDLVVPNALIYYDLSDIKNFS